MLLLILKPTLKCSSMSLTVSVFSMRFLLISVVTMIMTSISFSLLLVVMLSTSLVLWSVFLPWLPRSRFAPRLPVMLMCPSLEMRERSGSHEQPRSFPPGSMRCIQLLDGSTVRAWK